MKKIIISMITIGLLLTTSIASVNAFEKGELPGQPQPPKSPVPYIPLADTNIYVDDDNTEGPWDGTIEHPYQHIMDGINAANDSDTIFVFSGSYNEHVEIDKSITLTGENKETTSIMKGVEIDHTDYVTLKGFTITNNEYHDGIVIDTDSSNNTITENIVTKTWEGIEIRSSCNTISKNIITNITRRGIEFDHSSYNTVVDNTINNIYSNSQVRCITLYSSCNNTIARNTITDIYGDFVVFGFEIVLSFNNIISDNIISNICSQSDEHSAFANGIKVGFLSSDIILKGNSITDIVADGKTFSLAFGIEIGGNSFNVTVEENKIDNNNGGIYVWDSHHNLISENTISNSHIGSIPEITGSGILLENATFNTITNNELKRDNDIYASFSFSHTLEEGETYPGGKLPESYKRIRFEKDLSNNWSQNYWGRPRILPKIILGVLVIYKHDGQFDGTVVLVNSDDHPLLKSYNHAYNNEVDYKIQNMFVLSETIKKIQS